MVNFPGHSDLLNMMLRMMDATVNLFPVHTDIETYSGNQRTQT